MLAQAKQAAELKWQRTAGVMFVSATTLGTEYGIGRTPAHYTGQYWKDTQQGRHRKPYINCLYLIEEHWPDHNETNNNSGGSIDCTYVL